MFLQLWTSKSLPFFRRHLPVLTYSSFTRSYLTRINMTTEQHAEHWLTGPNSTQFYARTYTPPNSPKAAVVFVHGFAEHVGRYTHFHPLLAARGIAVLAFDQRGFGLTSQDKTGKKSKHSSYGKTSWKEQMEDINWAISHARKTFEGVPLFLMGHSMGGGEVLGFAVQGEKGAYKQTLDSLKGVIATSPLILQTRPVPKLTRWVGTKVGNVLPSMLVSAAVKAKHLSHDAEFNNAYLKDPLIKQQGSLKNVSDMLSQGEVLLYNDHVHWPKKLPVLIIHGTEDKVTSHTASKDFHDKIPAEKKKISLYDGGYHELQNEPAGVKEKLAAEVAAFIEEHIYASSSPPEGVSTQGNNNEAEVLTGPSKSKL
ncbi:Alpha/Beta hydrolase protein [Gymnopilus junonius]|uniref:Alpha/Beta hydrolase protein n=1 Tax=Gymnopilus junonius TaxID=109634 RepID=A0A9P5TSL9_GYMJU|nr:Alpha/Beta hydrolase protein [Gymnopilus junonius]